MKFTSQKDKTDKASNFTHLKNSALPKKNTKPQKTENKTGTHNNLFFKIITIIVFIISIISVVILAQFAQQTKKINLQNKLMAESINKVSSTLDKRMGTKFSRKLKNSNLLKEKDLNILLKDFNEQAKGIANQRNLLSLTLKKSADGLMLPREFKSSEFDNLSTTKTTSNSFVELLNKVNLRNDQLATAIINISTAMGRDMDINKFKSDNKNLLSLGIDPIIKYADNINDKLVSLNSKLIKTGDKLKKLEKTSLDKTTNIRELREIINTQQNKLTQTKISYNNLKKTLGKRKQIGEIKISKNHPELYYKLKGKIVEYNAKWGFIIVNLGKDNTIIANIAGNEKSVIVPIPTDKEVYIARGNKFLAKAKIVNIYDKYSVANIIFPAVDTIRVGDSVFFSEESSE